MIYLEDELLVDTEVHAALQEAGLDIEHNAEIQPSRIWVNNHANLIEKAPS